MSTNNVNANPNNMFQSPGPANNIGGVPRLAPSPIAQQPQHQINSNGNGVVMNGMNVGVPMSAGQQMDVNMLYQKVVELSEVLKDNREKTQGIVAGAEELAVSAMTLDGVNSNMPIDILNQTTLKDSCRCQWSKPINPRSQCRNYM